VSINKTRKYEKDHADQRVIEIAAGLVLSAVSLALIFWMIPANVSHTISEHDISPDFIPRAAAWTLLGLSLALIFDRLAKTIDVRKSIADSTKGSAILVQLVAWLTVAAVAYAGMAYVSFHVTAVALIVTGALVCHYPNWRILALVAIVTPVLIGQISWSVFSVKFT